MLENLRKLREAKGVSQKQLAEAVSVSQQSINKYENHNVEPDIATLIAIANFFNTSVDYLIGNSEIRRKIEVVHAYDLSDSESALIDNYRRLSKRQRDSITLVIDNYLDKI